MHFRKFLSMFLVLILVFSLMTMGVQAATPPDIPTASLSYDASGGIKITITEKVTCTGYVYCRSEDNGKTYSTIATTSATSFLDTNVEVGSKYYYRVYAYTDDVSNRSDSTLAGNATAKPKSVTIKSVSFPGKGVTLSWNAIAGVDGYKIFRRPTGTSKFPGLEYVSANTLSYTDTTAVNGMTYDYAVQSYQTVNGTKIYSLVEVVAKTVEVPLASGGTVTLTTIKDLNKNSYNGSHAADNFLSASLENNFRETVELNSTITGYTRYDNAYYPRVKKVKDDLYVLFYHYGRLGQHIYWATSNDGVNWNAPQVFWNSASHGFTYSYGSLEGTEDRLFAVNADACVLDNGEILVVYAVRPNKGYSNKEYTDLNGMYMRRGTVKADNTISWSAEQKIYTGQLWEPYIRQRDDGLVEIYWSSMAEYTNLYEFDPEKRSTYTALITSSDNGKTWTPDVQPGDGLYAARRIFKQYIGDKIPYGDYTQAVPYYGGQMPSVATLYNGKSLIAVEVQHLSGDFDLSMALSGDHGEWKDLGQLEAGPDGMMEKICGDMGAAPYLARFPSGEVYLTYTSRDSASVSHLYGRLISPDGTQISPTEFLAAGDAVGCWGATDMINSHEVMVAAHSSMPPHLEQ